MTGRRIFAVELDAADSAPAEDAEDQILVALIAACTEDYFPRWVVSIESAWEMEEE